MILLYILFWLGVVGFTTSVIWWLVELILKQITKKDKHFDRMMIACIVFNCFNLIVQISNFIIRNVQ